MAWDEWEQIKAAAAERHSTHMQLNQLAADAGGSAATDTSKTGTSGRTGTLRHSKGPWTKAAATAGDLKRGTASAEESLRSCHTGVATGVSGLVSLAALKAVLASWEERLSAVRDECGSLEPNLRSVARDLGETDGAVAAKARAVHVPEGGKKG